MTRKQKTLTLLGCLAAAGIVLVWTEHLRFEVVLLLALGASLLFATVLLPLTALALWIRFLNQSIGDRDAEGANALSGDIRRSGDSRLA